MSSKKEINRSDTTLGERLFSVRDESSQTLEQFAKSLGMKSGSYFSDLENGKKTTLSSELIIKICDKYNICHKWLLTGIGVMTYPAIIQKTDVENVKQKPSAEEERMLYRAIQELADLKKRIETIETKLDGEQKKNQSETS